jgi:ankyrin repeat protein
LDKGADCNARTNDGDSCLAFATAIGSVAVVHQLMDMGAEVNLTGEFGLTPLHWAATRQDEFSAEIVTMLLEKGADLSARDGSGETPADLATSLGQGKVLALLGAEAMRRAGAEAFAMGQHARLGAGSLVLVLEPELVRTILDQAWVL